MATIIFSTLRGVLSGKHPYLGVFVSVDGRVNVLDRGRRWDNPSFHLSKGSLDTYGYRYVRIRAKNYWVHRLVAETFLANHADKPTVDHIDRDKENNSLSNLRWATYKEQVENSAWVLSRQKFSVREYEDKKAYDKEYRTKHKVRYAEHARRYRALRGDAINARRRERKRLKAGNS